MASAFSGDKAGLFVLGWSGGGRLWDDPGSRREPERVRRATQATQACSTWNRFQSAKRRVWGSCGIGPGHAKCRNERVGNGGDGENTGGGWASQSKKDWCGWGQQVRPETGGSGRPWLRAPGARATSQLPQSFPTIVCAVTGRGSQCTS